NESMEIYKELIAVEGDANRKSYKAVGEVLTYRITVKNTGNVTIVKIEVRDPLTGLEHSIPVLAPGASESINTTYTVTQADLDKGSVVNLATAVGGDRDTPVNPSNPDDGREETPADTEGKRELNKTADTRGPVNPGDQITYTIIVTNTGNVTLSGIVVNDPMPGLSPIRFVSS